MVGTKGQCIDYAYLATTARHGVSCGAITSSPLCTGVLFSTSGLTGNGVLFHLLLRELIATRDNSFVLFFSCHPDLGLFCDGETLVSSQVSQTCENILAGGKERVA